MLRHCDGEDPNLPKPGCGRSFEDEDHSTICPHLYFAASPTAQAALDARRATPAPGGVNTPVTAPAAPPSGVCDDVHHRLTCACGAVNLTVLR